MHSTLAVTVAFTVTRHFAPGDAAAYVMAQLAAATTAALALCTVSRDLPADLDANARAIVSVATIPGRKARP